jgi:hypothetical protein
MYNVCRSALLAGSLLTLSLPASATTIETFDWTFTSPNFEGFNGSPVAGSGTITATESENGAWSIDSATGTLQDLFISSITATVTGVESPSVNILSITNDNLIYPAQAVVLDSSGLTFATSTGGISLSYLNGSYEESSHLGVGAGDFVLTAAAPESSTWVMMISGFAVLGFLSYRQSRKGAAAPLPV